ncbi:MAG: PEGA domain-containing protein [Kofleriaceae bacterium]
MNHRTAILILLGVLVGSPAHADNASAEAAFKRAKQLAKDGRWEQACTLYEQSYREEPQLGALLNVANCHEKIGMLATAWDEFRQAAALAKRKDDDRLRYATDRAARLADRVSRLKVVAAPKSPRGLVVMRADVDITSTLGTAVPLDPGDYAIKVSAPGFESWETTVSIKAGGETSQVALPRLERREPTAPVAARLPKHTDERPAVSFDRSPGSARRKLAVGIGVVGLASLGVGTVFGLRAMERSGEAYELCPSRERCSYRAEAVIRDGKIDRRNANIALGLGAASVITGIVLWVTAPSARRIERRSISFVPTHNGAAITGSF